MTEKPIQTPEEIIQKQAILINVTNQLKKEFVGINKVIDEVMNCMSSWFLFPNLQEKPIIINMWGLTGVGKSSLVNRIAQLLNYNEKYYHFDLGDNDSSSDWTIKNQLEEINDNVNGSPTIIALDEFQHTRTINQNGMEVCNSSRLIWQLLDSGKFQTSRSHYNLNHIYDLIQELSYLLEKGILVRKGKVIHKKELYNDCMTSKHESYKVNEDLSFVPEQYIEKIYELAKEKFASSIEIGFKLNTLNGIETIEFLNKLFSLGSSPKIIDCSKSLIFVLGNLDEAFSMSGDFNPDISADELYLQSLEVTLPIIKESLKARFRNEQIARLGNIHIIYPALNNDSFKKIIGLELVKISNRLKQQQRITITYDESIKELIYNEGVYPTQGVRPLFTTIHQIIVTKLGRILSEIFQNGLKISHINMSVNGDKLKIKYFDKQEQIHSICFKQELILEQLRANKKDDEQAITAVHESGHAIISCILLKTIPEVIFSRSVKLNSSGYVFSKFKWSYISKKEIQNRIALFLAGYAAEKIVFGADNISSGSESDFARATRLALDMIKSYGMGTRIGSYDVKHVSTKYNLHDECNAIDEEAEQWLKSAMKLAEDTLKAQRKLLLTMADYLSDNRSLSQKQIKEMLINNAHDFDCNSIIKNGDSLFYRNHLKKKVLSLISDSELPITSNVFSVSLNNNI